MDNTLLLPSVCIAVADSRLQTELADSIADALILTPAANLLLPIVRQNRPDLILIDRETAQAIEDDGQGKEPNRFPARLRSECPGTQILMLTRPEEPDCPPCDTDGELILPIDFVALENNYLKPVRTNNHRLRLLINDALVDFGILPSNPNYATIRTAIVCSVRDNRMLQSLTRTLYPTVAADLSSTSGKVERAIRKVIDAAWSDTDPELLENYFGSTIDPSRGRPTNSEFLATIVDTILVKSRRCI